MEWHENDLEWVDDANIPVGCWGANTDDAAEDHGKASVVVFQPRKERVLEMTIPGALIPDLCDKAIDLMRNGIARWEALKVDYTKSVYYWSTPTPPEGSKP